MSTGTASDRIWIGRSTDVAANLIPDQLWAHEEQTTSDPETEGWLGKIRAEVYKHPHVEAVFVSIGKEPLVDYWIVIPNRDIELVRTLVEDQQRRVISLFSGAGNPPFQLDFHICYREGRNARDLVPSEAIHIPKF